jgi:hypothetical protein
LHDAAKVEAFVDSRLKDIDIPTIHKVTMHAIACCITTGQNKRLRIPVPIVGEQVCLPDRLIEDRDQMDGVGVRA